jgi:hypothetical protein
MLGILVGLLVLVILFGLFLSPILIWRARIKLHGYPGLRAYLQELPWTDEQKWDAVELTLRGLVLCLLGLLFPPVLLIGLVPLYYGLRKLAWVKLAIKGNVEPE